MSDIPREITDEVLGEGRDLYDVAREVTDDTLGEGTYASLNENNPNPGVQSAIAKSREFEPPRIKKLPLNDVGYRVPWFVAWIDGKPDFRIIRPQGTQLAHRDGLCWICGETMGSYKTFMIGPMCAINRVSAEPPMHKECAIYSAKACPFMTRPNMRRRPVDGEVLGTIDAPGTTIDRNPGVTLAWTTKSYKAFRIPREMVQQGMQPGMLFEIGNPTDLMWFSEGRTATREEILTSIETGYPLLLEAAEQDGEMAVKALEMQRDLALKLVP